MGELKWLCVAESGAGKTWEGREKEDEEENEERSTKEGRVETQKRRRSWGDFVLHYVIRMYTTTWALLATWGTRCLPFTPHLTSPGHLRTYTLSRVKWGVRDEQRLTYVIVCMEYYEAQHSLGGNGIGNDKERNKWSNNWIGKGKVNDKEWQKLTLSWFSNDKPLTYFPL